MITLSAQFKHEMAKAFVHAILDRSGYTLVPCSMERLVREVVVLDHAAYKSIKMPELFRRLPDYLLFDGETKTRVLVDISYRKNLDDRFIGSIADKIDVMKEMVLILFNGGTTKIGTKQDLSEVVRCCKLKLVKQKGMIQLRASQTSMKWVPLNTQITNQIWDGMLPLHAVFSKVEAVEASLEAAVETAARAFAA